MKLRTYVPSIGITVGVFIFGVAALAGPGNPPSTAGSAATVASSRANEHASAAVSTAGSQAAEALQAVQAGVTETVTGTVTGHDVENHGRCVSFWVHRAREAGLQGKSFGEFVSSIAEDDAAVAPKLEDSDTPPATCAFSSELTAALAAQPPAATQEQESEGPGRSAGKGQGRGQSEQHKPPQPGSGS